MKRTGKLVLLTVILASLMSLPGCGTMIGAVEGFGRDMAWTAGKLRNGFDKPDEGYEFARR